MEPKVFVHTHRRPPPLPKKVHHRNTPGQHEKVRKKSKTKLKKQCSLSRRRKFSSRSCRSEKGPTFKRHTSYTSLLACSCGIDCPVGPEPPLTPKSGTTPALYISVKETSAGISGAYCGEETVTFRFLTKEPLGLPDDYQMSQTSRNIRSKPIPCSIFK